MGAFRAMWNSEKAVALGLLVIAATVLVALGKMSVADWQQYTIALSGFYVAGKTVQGIGDAMASAKVEAAKHTAGKTVDGKPEDGTTPL